MRPTKNNMIGVLVIAGFLAAITSCSNHNKEVNTNRIPGSDTVVINLMQFTPAKLNVEIGDTVTWINKDLVDHNVKDTISNLFYSDTLKTGKSFRWVVTGSANYICTIHPTMNGEIVIPNK